MYKMDPETGDMVQESPAMPPTSLDICRSCMKDENALVDLFPSIGESCASSLADMFMLCTPLQVLREDGLPQKLCTNCIDTLTTAYAFRNQAERSDNVLRGLVKSSPPRETSPVRIKQEPDVDTLLNVKEECEDRDYEEQTYQEEDEVEDRRKRKPRKCREKNAPFRCEKCGMTFYKTTRLEKHMKIHAKLKKDILHTCEVCKKTFLKLSGLNRHMANHDAESKPFECPQCFQRFKREGLLLRHEAIHTTGIDCQALENKEQTEYICEECNMSFDLRQSLSSHMRIHKKKDRSKSYACNICSKKFTSKNPLNRHMKLHSQHQVYKCHICEKKYSRHDQLLDHINKHNGVKPNVCPICNKGFSQLCNLKDHMRTHTGETPFLCSECGKGFNNGSNLRQHMMRHTGLKPFSCNLCPKRFSTKGQMTCHIGTHTGAHPYVCDTCGAAFTKPNSLKKHKLIHLGVKPHECDVCSMKFSCKDHLKRHYRIHTGEKPYKCTYCDRAFTQSNDLVKHTRSHIGDNIYKCTKCDASFRLLSELKNHYPAHYVKDSMELLELQGQKTQEMSSLLMPLVSSLLPQTSLINPQPSDAQDNPGNLIAMAQPLLRDSKTLISFDKHLDKSVITNLVVTDADTAETAAYQNVQTKSEPKDGAEVEEMTSPGVKIFVVDR